MNKQVLRILEISNCKVISSSNISGTSGHYPKFSEIEEQPEWNPISFRGKWKIEDNQWPAWQNTAKQLIFPPIKCDNDSDILYSNPKNSKRGSIQSHKRHL